jgi:hypothetical protein
VAVLFKVRIGRFVMTLRRWARKELESGDLSALSEITDSGRWEDPSAARVERLKQRGFITGRADQRVHVTLKGRAALIFGRRSRR